MILNEFQQWINTFKNMRSDDEFIYDIVKKKEPVKNFTLPRFLTHITSLDHMLSIFMMGELDGENTEQHLSIVPLLMAEQPYLIDDIGIVLDIKLRNSKERIENIKPTFYEAPFELKEEFAVFFDENGWQRIPLSKIPKDLNQPNRSLLLDIEGVFQDSLLDDSELNAFFDEIREKNPSFRRFDSTKTRTSSRNRMGNSRPFKNRLF